MRVFKYRGGDEGIFSRDLESLEKDTFWSPTINRLNDPCEGLVFHEDLLTQIDLTAGILGKGNKCLASTILAGRRQL